MTKEERINAEAQIKKYNAKGWKESIGAILLHKADAVIEHYKRKIEHLEEQLNPKL